MTPSVRSRDFKPGAQRFIKLSKERERPSELPATVDDLGV